MSFEMQRHLKPENLSARQTCSLDFTGDFELLSEIKAELHIEKTGGVKLSLYIGKNKILF